MGGEGSMNASDLFKMIKQNLKQWLVEKDICTDSDVNDTFFKLGLLDVDSVDKVIDKKCTREKMRSVGISDQKVEKIQKLQLWFQG